MSRLVSVALLCTQCSHGNLAFHSFRLLILKSAPWSLLPSLLSLFLHLPPLYFSLQKETARLAVGVMHECGWRQLQMSGAPPEQNSCCMAQHPLPRVGRDPGEGWEANEVKLVWWIAGDQADALTEAPDKDRPVKYIFISPECLPSWIENGKKELFLTFPPTLLQKLCFLLVSIFSICLHEQYIQFSSYPFFFLAESLPGCNSWHEAFSCLLQHLHSFPGITGGKILSANVPEIFQGRCCFIPGANMTSDLYLYRRCVWHFFLEVCGREGFAVWWTAPLEKGCKAGHW